MKFLSILSCLVFLSSCSSFEKWAAPKPRLNDELWKVRNESSSQKVDHSIWSSFLSKYLKSNDSNLNLVNYKKVSKKDHEKLKEYLLSLEKVRVSDLNSDEQFAFWVNLYNAKTIDLILQHYPVKSILDIKFGILSFGPWTKKLISIMGKKLSLNDIEHGILRPIWQDHRTHYAVNCASIGCPNLQMKAFSKKNKEQLLKQGEKEYLQSQRGFFFKKKSLKVSKIYLWFEKDFLFDSLSILEYLKKYSPIERKKKLKEVEKIDGYVYDWKINEVK